MISPPPPPPLPHKSNEAVHVLSYSIILQWRCQEPAVTIERRLLFSKIVHLLV
jgi:hypothetical protein